jgi:hypothetical protein
MRQAGHKSPCLRSGSVCPHRGQVLALGASAFKINNWLSSTLANTGKEGRLQTSLNFSFDSSRDPDFRESGRSKIPSWPDLQFPMMLRATVRVGALQAVL